MAKGTYIPKRIRERTLEEFKHRCALCGKIKPHIHHINGDLTNHHPLNLIPLCRKCKIKDSHDPTRSPDVSIIAIFKKHRDPHILKPQFKPLFMRLNFLVNLHEDCNFIRLRDQVDELIQFVFSLKMGFFYANRISELIWQVFEHYLVDRISYTKAGLRELEHAIFVTLEANRAKVIELIIELLRYQKWE